MAKIKFTTPLTIYLCCCLNDHRIKIACGYIVSYASGKLPPRDNFFGSVRPPNSDEIWSAFFVSDLVDDKVPLYFITFVIVQGFSFDSLVRAFYQSRFRCSSGYDRQVHLAWIDILAKD